MTHDHWTESWGFKTGYTHSHKDGELPHNHPSNGVVRTPEVFLGGGSMNVADESAEYVRKLYGLLDDAAMLFRHAEECGRFLPDETERIERWRGKYRETTSVYPRSTPE